MLKRLRIYYFYVALPFVALLTGAAIYHQQIARTITANPHPQINYAIFAIIIMGGMLILRGVHRLMQEVRALARFSDAVRSKMPQAELPEMTINLDVDIAYVLRMLAATSKEKTITHQEQFALENELSKSRSRLASRTALPQFLSGLLVGMGLLGTFIGLLATLSDISLLISSFADINMTTANPLDVFRNMIERMKAPMQSMGIAFSASLFGLLGSIILGLMMVGVRRCMGDLMSLLGSEVAQQIELSLANDGFAYSKSALKQGVAFSGDSAARNSVEALAKSLALLIESGGGWSRMPRAVTAPLASADIAGTASDEAASSPMGSAADVAPQLTQAAVQGERVSGGSLVSDEGEEVRILLRIEERLAENARMQLRTLNAEVDDFQKQRGDMLRSLAEQNEATNNFRSELQRVGRQLGTILGIMEKGNTEVMTQISELMIRMSDDSAETHRLLRAQLESAARGQASPPGTS